MKRAKKSQWPAPPPVTAGLLQRKCGCGGESGLAGECKDCRDEKQKLQRSEKGPAREPVPQVVHEVLSSPGELLEESTRTSMESRFGHDFSNVRVHTDSRAGESADAVNAIAYTVGHNIVFGNGKYAPATTSGRELIAHELTHVVQQSGSPASSGAGLTLDKPNSQMEQQADQASSNINHGDNVHASLDAQAASVQRQPKPPTATKAPPKKPAKGAEEPEKKTYPVENCPHPSDFADPTEAGTTLMCAGTQGFDKAPECNLTDKHFKSINEAKESARKRVERAERRMHWFGGPEYAERIAKGIFQGTPPDTATIKDTLTKMVKILGGSGMPFKGATCADPLCESWGAHALAYESGPSEPVRLCVRQFLPQYVHELPRTIIHEAVHLAGIDIDPNVKERYCEKKGCQEKCDDTTNAEAWTMFIDCLGGSYIKPKEPKPEEASASSGTPAKEP